MFHSTLALQDVKDLKKVGFLPAASAAKRAAEPTSGLQGQMYEACYG